NFEGRRRAYGLHEHFCLSLHRRGIDLRAVHFGRRGDIHRGIWSARLRRREVQEFIQERRGVCRMSQSRELKWRIWEPGAWPSTSLAFLFWCASAAFANAAEAPLSSTNIFAPASTPAKSIFDLSLFVLVVTALIFGVVFTLLAYAVVKFR